MRTRPAFLLLLLVVVSSACTRSDTTPTTQASTTTTTTLIPTTTEAVEETSTTTSSTTTTAPPETTTTEAGEETSTTTTRVDISTTTTIPPEDAIDELVPYAGLYRQPTVWSGYLDFRANGVIAAGTDPYNLSILGTWTYDEETDFFIFSDFDFGPDGCADADGIYERERAPGGGRRILLVDDPCQARVDFMVQPGSECACFLYNLAELPTPDEN